MTIQRFGRIAVFIAIGIALLPFTACQPQQSAAPAVTPAAGKATAQAAAPRLHVTTLEGAAWDLTQQRGKWVIVNYWATWCGPCLQEMPELSALAAMRSHIAVIGLAYEDSTVEDLRAFMQTRPVTYPIALISVYTPPQDFGAPRGLPTTWLIRPDGRLARKYTGPVTARMLDEDIAQLGGPKAG